MKRNINLIPSSWQHHDELLSCLLIKKGVQKNADLALLTDFTNIFWKDDLQKHIEVEEKILFPFLVKHRFDNKYISMMKTDNSLITSVFERLTIFDNRHKVFEIFANLVEQHIRFTERFIFGKVQELLTEEELKELGLQLPDLRSRKCTDYPVKFWE
jgi:hemerythrin superfamily protein